MDSRLARRAVTRTALLSLLALLLLPVQASQASDIASFKTVFATDVAYAGFGGMRDNGTGTLSVAGVSGTVKEAYLYWHGPTNTQDAAANAAVTFAGQGVTGTHIGFSDNNCWGYQNSQAYRADVTSLVSGNGDYALADFVKDGGEVNVNGASLLVFFDDGNGPNNRDVVLFDGNDSNIPNSFDADGWNVSLSGINYQSGSASMDLHVSDGQTFDDDALVLNGQELEPAGDVFNGETVPGNGQSASDRLWDIRQFDVTSFLSPGENTLTLTTGQNSDCLSLVVAAVNLPAGSAPNQPPPPATACASDSEAPNLAIRSNQGKRLYRRGERATVRVRATDESGLRRNPSTQARRLSTSKVGRARVRATAVDNCGRSTTRTFNYRVAARPGVRVAGVSGLGCRSSSFDASITVRARGASVRRVTVSLDGRRLTASSRSRLRVAIAAGRLRPGTHELTVTATDRAGNRTRRSVSFSRCRPVPITLTG